MSWKQFALAAGLVIAGSPAFAADMGPRSAQCTGDLWSPILTLASIQQISAEVHRRYEEALNASKDPRVVDSRRQVYDWALETRISCAKAIGFLKANEVNQYQIGQCDCFYGLMYVLAH